MSSEVRLACAGDAETFVASSSGTWIALPAAEFEAWRRVVEAAHKVRSEVIVFEWHQIEPFECDLLQALNDAVDALPNNQQSGPAVAKEGE